MSGYYHMEGGCHTCSKHWLTANAQGLAARHHQSTGHRTWWEAGYTYGGA